MTTTAFDDQFTAEPEHVTHRAYDTAAILRQNVADLELELQRQRERADKAEAELKAAREQPADQKPWAWDCGGDITTNKEYADWFTGSGHGEAKPLVLYTRPIPAPAPAVPYGVDQEAANRISLAVYDWEKGINPEPLLYAINRILATEAHPLSEDGLRAMLQSGGRK